MTINYPSGALAIWKLDELSGNVANDSSLNNRNATIQGSAPIIDGKFGKARSLQGAAVYRDNIFLSNSNLTVSALLRVDTSSASTIVYNNYLCGVTNKFASGVSIGLSSDGNYAINYCDGPHISIPSNAKAISLKWTHLVLTKNANEYKLYIDGSLRLTTFLTHNIGLNFSTCYQNSGNFYSGIKSDVDEITVWDRTLTDIEVNKLTHEYLFDDDYCLIQDGNKIYSYSNELNEIGQKPVSNLMIQNYGINFRSLDIFNRINKTINKPMTSTGTLGQGKTFSCELDLNKFMKINNISLR